MEFLSTNPQKLSSFLLLIRLLGAYTQKIPQTKGYWDFKKAGKLSLPIIEKREKILLKK